MKPWRLDCRYFLGDRPCKFKRTCPACPHYSPMGQRILIVKLAAIGDVLRTTPLLWGLKRAYPQSHITWVVDKEAFPLLRNNSLIDRLIPYEFADLWPLESEKFDLVIGLEKEVRGAALVSKVEAREKKGFGLAEIGNIYPLNKGSEYAFLLGLDDDLKFYHNKKTYPELVFEIADLPYQKDEYLFTLSPADKKFAGEFAQRAGLKKSKVIIGLNTGAGDVFANKAWTINGFGELIKKLQREPGVRVLLLGGPKEQERNAALLERYGEALIDTGCHNSLTQFAALVNLCDIVVTGDTTALHLAIALKKMVVAIFGPTCAQEIELYGRGEIVKTTLACAPCYRRECPNSPNCMEVITPEEVMQKIKRFIQQQLERGD